MPEPTTRRRNLVRIELTDEQKAMATVLGLTAETFVLDALDTQTAQMREKFRGPTT